MVEKKRLSPVPNHRFRLSPGKEKVVFPGSGQSGFTLIELLISLVVAGFVLGCALASIISQKRTTVQLEHLADMQQNLRAALYMLERDIRLAGFDPGSGNGAGIIIAAADRFGFTRLADNDNLDNDGDGIADDRGELDTIIYSIYDSGGDGNRNLGRQAGYRDKSGRPVLRNRQAAAYHIDAVEFFYTLRDGRTTSNPKASDLKNIYLVRVSLLARAVGPDRRFFNTSLYIPASGKSDWDINGPDPGTGNPPEDRFHRHLAITAVQCRNMGAPF